MVVVVIHHSLIIQKIYYGSKVKKILLYYANFISG